MKTLLYTLTFLFSWTLCSAQNLVPNPGFEQNSNCPAALGNYFVTDWFAPTTGSSDYFHQCSASVGVPGNSQGYQPAHGGIAYCGLSNFTQPPFVAEYREYMEVQLSSALKANTCYHFEMYVARANVCQIAISELGAHFSNGAVTATNWDPLTTLTPQVINTTGVLTDTLNWTLIDGTFMAVGGEDHLIVGNFKDDANTTFQFEDLTASHEFAYYYVDDVSLTECESNGIGQNESFKIEVYPNPFSDQVAFKLNDNVQAEVILFDVSGAIILKQQFVGSVSLNTSELASGIYLYQIQNEEGYLESGKLTKH
jgi:hypothetical protein